MSQDSTTLTEMTAVNTAPESNSPMASAEKPSPHIQEKVMLALVLVFVGGVLGMTIIPEPFNGVVSGLVLFLALVAMFRMK